MEERSFIVLMRELCAEMGIDLKKMSYGWILQLKKDGIVRYLAGNRFDNNSEAAGRIACDKYATYEVLKNEHIPVVKHTMLFNPLTRGKFVGTEGVGLTVVSEFLKNGCVVVKPNTESEGRGVTLCRTLKETEIAIQKLFKSNGSISICPFYDIKTEYRTFYLNGKVHLIYGKTKPFVVGNGKSTMGELIEKLDLPKKSIVEDNLKILDLTYVPKKNEKVEVSWKHNLSGGAKPVVLEKSELYDKISEISIQTGKAMNMNFATIDIIQTSDDELYVLEVNSGVCTRFFIENTEGGYDIVKEIYKEAIKALFQ